MTFRQDRLVYTVSEVQQLLGLGRSTTWDRIHDGSIPSVKVGGRVLVPKTALDAMLAVGSRRETEQTQVGEQQ